VQYPGARRKVRPARATGGLLDYGTRIVEGDSGEIRGPAVEWRSGRFRVIAVQGSAFRRKNSAQERPGS
jgi:hypothetical protein